MTLILGVAIPVLLIVVAFLVIAMIFSRMYNRSTREVSLVKTGTGGRKVIIDGGTLVIPVLHEVTRINMRTTRLEVRRDGNSALITKDRMRVDVGVEFYVTVQATEEGIARAAQTLGDRTFDERALREMVEGKLVDGLRAVAAKMDLDDLHENRANFVQQVQQTVTEDLRKNGLELESVSLTALDQTPLSGLDENNVFNAEGMKNQAERIAQSRKQRAAIEADAEVAVARSRQEAEVKRYEVEREQEEARVAQRVKMEELAAREEAEKARQHEEAEMAAQQARIAREKAIEVAEQDRQIAVSEKSEAESQARARADLAKAEAIKATEAIETERRVAEGERQKRLTILAAQEEAERQATSIRVAAKAEREAADDRAAAMRELAQAEADQITIRAEAAKKEALAEAEGMRARKLAEAEGTRALAEAENGLSEAIVEYRLAQARLEAMPKIVAEMVKPAEKIGGITIHKVDGLGNASTAAEGAKASGGDGLVNQAFDEMRKMAFQLPALDSIGKQVGLNMEKGMSGLFDEVMPKPSAPPEASAAAPAAQPAQDV
ncbi:flotillin domain-containing protein [Thioclava sp. FTW29]|uniref:Flotillin domain-containing protein n=1 Tax=Thioclava litoralis TaxID=3076557 RepID=A0ABZ1E6J9_9RHOB|nr:flotillin domain-containing protein [Thioclava sp. FTW29]